MIHESRAVTGGIVVGDFRRFLALMWTLAVTDWKLRFYGSVLGYVWQLARPFAFFGVIYVVFTQIAHLGDDVENYGVYILFALVLFNFFAEVTNACVRSLVARENLLRKISFPRLAIPMAITLTGLFNLGGTLVAVFIFAIGSGVYPDWGWLELVPADPRDGAARQRRRDAAQRAVRALPRHRADLGGRSPRSSSTRRRSST